MGRGKSLNEALPNGAFVEGVVQAAIGRLQFYQTANKGKFACRENAIALTHLEEALMWLEKRTADREAREVEGTHTHTMKLYVAGAAAMLVILLVEMLTAVQNGTLKLDGFKTRADWLQLGVPLFSSILGHAAIWPLTALYKCWLYVEVARRGVGPTTTVTKSDFWPDELERVRQTNHALAELYAAADAGLFRSVRPIVAADAFLYAAWVQHYTETQGWGLSDAQRFYRSAATRWSNQPPSKEIP